jgi:hypothetical protein
MVFRHCVDFLSLKVTEGSVDRPLAYDATMLTMLDTANISASGTSCTRVWLAPTMRKQISPFFFQPPSVSTETPSVFNEVPSVFTEILTHIWVKNVHIPVWDFPYSMSIVSYVYVRENFQLCIWAHFTSMCESISVVNVKHWFSKCGPRANTSPQKHSWRPTMTYRWK